KVVFRGAAYYRPDWQSVVRQAPKRVRDVPEGVLCSLWALGRPVEDHLLLASEGDLLRVLEPVVHECPARPMPPEAVGPGAARGAAAGGSGRGARLAAADGRPARARDRRRDRGPAAGGGRLSVRRPR